MVIASTAMRARRPVLPALTAVLAGALVAGGATLFTGAAAESGGEQPQLSVGLTGQRPDASGRLTQPSTSATTTTTTAAAPTTTTTTPPTSAPPETTTPPPAPPVTTEPPVTTQAPNTSAQDQVVALTNVQRQQNGCGPLSVDASITAAAQGHAKDMADRDYFEHTTPEGVTFDQRIRSAGYSSPGAENIAMGARTAAQVVDLWMKSPGHRANILNCDLDVIGVGLDTDGFYWVQDFGF
jgi:uncharacterized protein YkwD